MSVQISGASSAHQFNSEVYNVVVVVDDDYDDDDDDDYDDDCLNSLLKKLCPFVSVEGSILPVLDP
jgi:hypothetical protein